MHNRQATIHSGIYFHVLPALWLVLMLGLTACSQNPGTQPVTTSPQPVASATQISPVQLTSTLATSIALPGVPPTPGLTPTPACNTQLGQVEKIALDTVRMYEPFKFRVYLPPCYAQDVDQHYPVLYLFHGLFFSDDQWTRIGAVEVVNRLILTGQIAPFIIIMPYDPNQREPASTTFDEVFMEDLLPYIDENFRTLPGPEHRAVGGLSRGAGWAIHFGLTNPSLFGIIGAHSPIIFWEDSIEIGNWLNAIQGSRMPRIYVDIGESDSNPDSAILLENLLMDRNIPHEYHVSPGYHTEQYWRAQVESYIRWYAAGW